MAALLFTNATGSGSHYDEKTQSCMGQNKNGSVLGLKTQSSVLQDCIYSTGMQFKALTELKKMRGVDLMSSSVDIATPINLQMEASNLFDFNFNNTKLAGAEISQSIFYRPLFQKNSIADSKFYESKFFGPFENATNLDSGPSTQSAPIQSTPIQSTVELEISTTNLERTTLAGFAWKDLQFNQVNFSNGTFRNMKVTKFQAKKTEFSKLAMSEIDLTKAEFFGSNFKQVRICGQIGLGQSYWSHSDIDFQIDSDIENCKGVTQLNFSKASLRYAAIKIASAKADSVITFAEADLRGARLQDLNLSTGRWNFKGALVDETTQFPENFPYKKDLVFEKPVNKLAKAETRIPADIKSSAKSSAKIRTSGQMKGQVK